MDHDEVLALFDDKLRRNTESGDPGTLIERDGAVLRQVGGKGGWNGVIWSDLDEAGADEAIAAQVRHFSGLGLMFEWKTYSHDRPADLAERLLAAGFMAEPDEALMIARIEDLATEVVLPEGIRLEQVTTPAGVDLVVQAHTEAFGIDFPGYRERLLETLRQDEHGVSMVVALAGDRPVSAARMELNPGTGFAGLWGGGTAADWRGKGIYRALVAHRARQAADLGYQYLRVDATDDSRPILQRLGFARLATTTPYIYQP